MKRNRETTGEKDTAKAVNASKKPKTLEEVRAKLEQARLKKLAAEERLLRRKQQQGQPTKSDAISFNTNVNARAQEAQEALGRARSRFLVVQQQQYSTGTQQQFPSNAKPWNRRQHYASQNPYMHSLPPISALSSSFSLKIDNVADSGPPGIVYHYPDCVGSPWSSIGPIGSRQALIQAMGGMKAVEALQLAREDREDVSTLQKKSAINKKPPAAAVKDSKKMASRSLLQRKIKLQNELLALKEKLEMKPSQEKQKDQTSRNSVDSSDTDARHDEGTADRKLPPTKEGLERRKAEAQTVMDISYWKRFVSKQEHLLEQVTTKINNMDKGKGGAYKECLEKRHSTNKAIAKVQQDLDVLERRQAVVEEGIETSTQQLLDARQALHQAKTLQKT